MAFKTAPTNTSASVRDRLRVAAVQMTFAPTIDGNLAKIESLLGETVRRQADVVLLPECASDSKIAAPDERVLGLADNQNEAVIVANLDLSKATGVYARRGMTNPPFLAPHWTRMVEAVKRQAARSTLAYDLPQADPAGHPWPNLAHRVVNRPASSGRGEGAREK